MITSLYLTVRHITNVRDYLYELTTTHNDDVEIITSIESYTNRNLILFSSIDLRSQRTT